MRRVAISVVLVLGFGAISCSSESSESSDLTSPQSEEAPPSSPSSVVDDATGEWAGAMLEAMENLERSRSRAAEAGATGTPAGMLQGCSLRSRDGEFIEQMAVAPTPSDTDLAAAGTAYVDAYRREYEAFLELCAVIGSESVDDVTAVAASYQAAVTDLTFAQDDFVDALEDSGLGAGIDPAGSP